VCTGRVPDKGGIGNLCTKMRAVGALRQNDKQLRQKRGKGTKQIEPPPRNDRKREESIQNFFKKDRGPCWSRKDQVLCGTTRKGIEGRGKKKQVGGTTERKVGRKSKLTTTTERTRGGVWGGGE